MKNLNKSAQFFRTFAILTLFSIMLNACNPAPGPLPGPTEPVASSTGAPTKQIVSSTSETSFKVKDPGTPLAPQIIDRTPSAGTELPVDSAISLTFDQDMNEQKTAASWKLTDNEGKTTPGNITWSSSRNLQFTPARQLQSGATYIASLSDKASSAEGVALTSPFTFQFSTVGDLEVSQVFPAADAKDVSANSAITVIFNRPVVPLMIVEDQSQLPQPLKFEPEVDGKGEWINTSVFSFQPANGLQGGATYKVTVDPNLQDVIKASHLKSSYQWSFSTSAPAIEMLEISSGQANPPDNYRSVLLDTFFTIRFLQPMDKSSVETNLSLDDKNGTRVQLKKNWNEDSTTIIFTPTLGLHLNTDYVLNLDTSTLAAQGGKLKEGLNWHFSTIPPPAVVSTEPANGSTQDSFSNNFYIRFASPMRIDTVKDRIIVTPTPAEDIQWYYNEWDWSMSGFGFEPSTQYEIRFLPGMQDIYGNTMQNERTVRFTTGKRYPFVSLAMPYDVPVFRAFGPSDSHDFYTTYTNISRIKITLASLSPQQMIQFLGGVESSYQYKPPENTIIWQKDEPSKGVKNEVVLQKLSLVDKNGEPLKPGFYLLGLDAPEVTHTSSTFADYRIITVAGSNLTFKSGSTDALVWLTDLETGKPQAGVPVTVYNKNLSVLGSANTDGDGLARFNLPEADDPYESRFAISEDPKAFGFASSQWGNGANLYDYGIWSSYFASANQPVVYVYTERPLYRPGQPVFFKGIVRLDDDLNYSLPKKDSVQVKITSYKDTVYDDILKLSPEGSFDGKLMLDPEAALGAYTIQVSYPNTDQVIGSLTFNVAEYRKPEFQVSVKSNLTDVLDGDEFTTTVQADYFSGGGVSGASVNWTLLTEPFNFSPPQDYSSYSFRDSEEDVHGYEDFQDNSQVIAEGNGETDSAGQFINKLLADLSDSKTDRQLTYEATVTDIAQTAVSGRATVIAHKSSVYPGVKPENYIGMEGKEQKFLLVVLDWDGNPLSTQSLNIEIVERRWNSVQEQDATGRIEWKTAVEDISVAEIKNVITDEKGEASISFIPPNGGIFRVKATTLDPKGNTGAASAFLWVTGKEYIPWQQTNDHSFDLLADKKTYEPGETAKILIASPFKGEATALLTIERGNIHYQKVLTLTSNSTVVGLKITPNLAPNAYVSVLIMKGVDDENPRPNFKLGIREIQVDPAQRTLQVELIPDHPTAGPGEQVSFTVRTLNQENKPVSAEVSLGLSDLATLSLFPPNSTPIEDFFFSKRSLGIWTVVPLSLSVDDYNAQIQSNIPTGESQGSGGGKGEGDLGVVEIRQDFPDTAFWDPNVRTGSNGEATVRITLPDNLTTWRMDARATTPETLVGQANIDIISTKPLLVRPQTPRFFTTGDQARIGTAVHNNSDKYLTVKVSLQASGLTINGSMEQTVEIAAKKQAYVTWDCTVDPQAKRVDLVFSAVSGELKDASRPPQGTLDNQGIPVYRFEAHETTGTSGMLSEEETRVEGISLPKDLQVTNGSLNIQLSPSLAASMTEGFTYLNSFAYESIEQTISSFLPNVVTTRALKSTGLSEPELESKLKEQVSTSLQRIYNRQNPDGGWGWWGGEKSDPLTSGYVIFGLNEADQAGYDIDHAVSDRGINYVKTQIVSITGLKDQSVVDRQVFLLFVLAKAGKANVSSTVQLYDQRQRMSRYAQAFLAQTLYTIDKDDPRVSTMVSDLSSAAIQSATGAHWEEKQTDRTNWNTDTRTTAIILSTLAQIDPKSTLTINAVRWLMSHRTQGQWRGTQETAWSLIALTDWMVASDDFKASYDYAVALNGKQLGAETANTENLRKQVDLQVDIAELLKDEINRLAIARSAGDGTLYYTAYLDLDLPVEKIEPLERGVSVTRSYYQLDDLEHPVSSAKVGDLLLAKITVVAPQNLHYLIVNDPLPAGLEAVDQSLTTSPQNTEIPQLFTPEDIFKRGWGWWYFTNIQRMDEKVVLSTNTLPPGTYIYTYLLRASTAGQFYVVPTTVQELYFPDVYGRGWGSRFTVVP